MPCLVSFAWIFNDLYVHLYYMLIPNERLFISGFATVRTLLLLLCALLPIFVLFSDLSKIFTSADQHSAQTTHFLEKEDFLPPTASSLHSGDR